MLQADFRENSLHSLLRFFLFKLREHNITYVLIYCNWYLDLEEYKKL